MGSPRPAHIAACVLLAFATPAGAQSVLSDDDLQFRTDQELVRPYEDKVQATRRRDIQAGIITVGSGALVAGTAAIVGAVWAGLDAEQGPVSEVQLLGGGAVILAAGVAVLAVPIIDIVLSLSQGNNTILPYSYIEPSLSGVDGDDLAEDAAREEEVRWLLAALCGATAITAWVTAAGVGAVSALPRVFNAPGSTVALTGIDRILLGASAVLFGAGVTAAGVGVYLPFSRGNREIERDLRDAGPPAAPEDGAEPTE